MPRPDGGTRKDLRYDSAPARREHMLDLIHHSGYWSLGDLARELGVSDMTVRRDLGRLADQGLVRVVHGGVSAVTDLQAPVEFRFRSQQHTAAKRAIADHALSLLEPASVVGIDAGTTLLEVARRLPTAAGVTVVTHSVPVMALLANRPDVALIGLGGDLHREGQAFSGPLAVRALSQLRIQTLLLGAAAVRDGRLWSTNGLDAEVKQALIESSDRIVVLADSSKFAYSSLMLVTALDAVDVLVTDDGITDADRTLVEATGVELVVVSGTDAS